MEGEVGENVYFLCHLGQAHNIGTGQEIFKFQAGTQKNQLSCLSNTEANQIRILQMQASFISCTVSEDK